MRRRDAARVRQGQNRASDSFDEEILIGRPNARLVDSRTQGYINRDEAAMANALWNEHEEFGDIAFMASRDTSIDLPTKTLEVMKRGVLHKAKYIVKMDDNFCMDLKAFIKQVKQARDPKYGYFANSIQDEQSGADGKVVKYMSGPFYALTFALAKLITFSDINWVAMYPIYGSSSEAVDMGKWVKYAMDTHNITVKYIVV